MERLRYLDDIMPANVNTVFSDRHSIREELRLADLVIAKQRNGPIGKVPLRFLGSFTRFENRIDDLPEEPPE